MMAAKNCLIRYVCIIKNHTMYKLSLLLLFLFTISLVHAQKDPFYLEFKSDDKYPYQYSCIQFASLNEEELIYLRTYTIKDTFGQQGIVTGYDNYMVLSTTKGDIKKQINIMNDSLQMNCLLGTRHLDRILVFGSASKDSVSYLTTFTFDLQLNLIYSTVTRYPEILFKEIYFPMYNSFEDKKYILLNDMVPNYGGIALVFNKDGKLELEKKAPFLNGATYAGFTMAPAKDKLLFVTNEGGLNKYLKTYDLNFNFINSKVITKDVGVVNYDFRWFANYVKNGDGYICFGKAYRRTEDSLIYGKVLSELDSDFNTINKHYIDMTTEVGYTDGPPRYTGGLFKGTDGYYTCYEIVATLSPQYTSTFVINKYDLNLLPVWERRFIPSENIKYWNYYAELSPDNRFIISGDANDQTAPFFEKDFLYGHIFGLDENGSLLSNSQKINQYVFQFSILGNPAKDQLIIEKLFFDDKNYSVNILDIQGKVISINTQWLGQKMEVNVNSLNPGTFVCQILEGNNIKYVGKFVKL